MGAASDTATIGSLTLQGFAADLLRAGGFTADQAEQTAAMLVWANLRGADLHGVLRIPRYVEMVQLGLINPSAEPRQVSGKGAVAVLDADRAPGAVAMNLAARTAMQLSDVHGIGWCAVRSISHAGAIGYYANQVAQAGRVGIAMTASKPLMIYHGSSAEGISTTRAMAAPTTRPDRPCFWTCRPHRWRSERSWPPGMAGRRLPPAGPSMRMGAKDDPSKVKRSCRWRAPRVRASP